MNSLTQYILAFGMILVNMMSLCFTHIEWSWNLTAYIRILGPVLLFVLFDPVVAMILTAGVLDSVEPRINRNNINYHLRDKKLDLWGYLVAIIAIQIRRSNNPLFKYRNLLTILFILRAVGNLGFIGSGNRKWLCRFPNWFEVVFITLPIINQIPLLKHIKYPLLVAFCIIKLIIECIHHNTQIREKIIPFRWMVKSVCPGKHKMYKRTGTYPVDTSTLYSSAPVFQET
jgi:hypothetical protein